MQNARLDEAQAGIKIAGRNINNRRYADNTILMAESKEELKSLLMRVKRESKKKQKKRQLMAPSAIRVVSSVYRRLLISLPEIWIPACAAASLAF